jgi:23S rRNA (cytosine1962-C5)-methyltransferase
MWIADRWKDYEVIDTSNGEKLERWGDYILVRPDPQVIWNTPHKEPRWKQKNGHYHRSPWLSVVLRFGRLQKCQ